MVKYKRTQINFLSWAHEITGPVFLVPMNGIFVLTMLIMTPTLSCICHLIDFVITPSENVVNKISYKRIVTTPWENVFNKISFRKTNLG